MIKTRSKAIVTLAAALLTAGTSLTVGASTAAASATATPAVAADPNCTGYGMNSLLDNIGPDYSARPIKNRTTGEVVGSVQLCHRFVEGDWIRWAAVTLYYDMSANQEANGRIMSHLPGTSNEAIIGCGEETEGTGWIIGGTGDRTCATGPSRAHPGWKGRADGAVYNGSGTLIAYGATPEYTYVK